MGEKHASLSLSLYLPRLSLPEMQKAKYSMEFLQEAVPHPCLLCDVPTPALSLNQSNTVSNPPKIFYSQQGQISRLESPATWSLPSLNKKAEFSAKSLVTIGKNFTQ